VDDKDEEGTCMPRYTGNMAIKTQDRRR